MNISPIPSIAGSFQLVLKIMLDVVPLVYFYFCCPCFWCYIQNHCQDHCPEAFPYILSRHFTILNLIFKSWIHLFLFIDKKRVQFYSFACGHPVFLTPFVETIPLPSCVLGTPVEVSWQYMHGFISGISISVSLVYHLSLYQYHTVLITIVS